MDENLFCSDHRKIAPRLMGLNREFTLSASQIRHRFRQERRTPQPDEVPIKDTGTRTARLRGGCSIPALGGGRPGLRNF
jgi:hypothetical protein